MAKDAKDERHGVTLGFQGGGGLALRLVQQEIDGLLEALAGGEWFDVQDADGPVRINLSQVVFVRAETYEQRVGFGLG